MNDVVTPEYRCTDCEATATGDKADLDHLEGCINRDADHSKMIIAGSRSIDESLWVYSKVNQLTDGGASFGMYEVITGGAEGVDSYGETWAEEKSCLYTEFPYPSQLGSFGGPRRNKAMASYVGEDGMLIAIWDGESSGTENMIEEALAHGLDVHVKQVHDA